ncbi:MAG: hypothetical protein ABL971_09880 [Vicinamibacterales bacterium]
MAAAPNGPFATWERVIWRSRRAAVTDLRVVHLRRGRIVGELATTDVASVTVEPSAMAWMGAGTLVIAPRTAQRAGMRTGQRPDDRPLRIPGVWRARHVALTLNLVVADLQGVPPHDSITSLPMPSIWKVSASVPLRASLISPLILGIASVGVMGYLATHQVREVHAADDPIRPHGVKRSRQEIVAFMEGEVMPFAVAALEPVVGKGKVRCETCHGANAVERDWRMPAVAKLPEPGVTTVAARGTVDSRLRNALHGYLADAGNQRVTGHMRGVVLPGMAALLHRPAYNFAQPYDYNVEHSALGCYHCHLAD